MENTVPTVGEHLRNLADEVLVISLPERLDRRERVSKMLQEEKIPFRFVDGVRVRRDNISNDEISEMTYHEFKVLDTWDAYIQAAIGCKRAHIHCMTQGLEAGVESLLILEDDVAFREDWYPKYLEARKSLPRGWLQLYLSASLILPPNRVNPYISRLTRSCQTTAILYSRDGLEAGLNCIQSARCELDWWMGIYLNKYGCSYVMDPQITFQTGGYSDCRGGVRGEMP